jgi:hypothetical protein
MLIYEDKVPQSYRTAFIAKVKDVATRLGINPNWLMQVMYFESAKTFSPSIKNPYTGATGLIQFMPTTATGLGTTVLQLSQMSAVEQLEYVYKYYAPYKAKIKSYVDLYLTTFFPLAVGKDGNFIIQTSKISAALIATQNPAFDLNKDGQITVKEITEVMLSKVPKNWLSVFQKKKPLQQEESSSSEPESSSPTESIKKEFPKIDDVAFPYPNVKSPKTKVI